MQKFVINQSAGGFHLTKAAALYLDAVSSDSSFGQQYLDGKVRVSDSQNDDLPYRVAASTHPEHSEVDCACISTNGEYVGYLPITAAWLEEFWVEDDRSEFDEIDMDAIVLNMEPRKDLLLDALEKLEDFHELDRINNGCIIRVVEVPDNVAVTVKINDLGAERVEEVHRTFYPEKDWAVTAKRKIMKFFSTHTAKTLGVSKSITYKNSDRMSRIENDGIVYVLGDYTGIAKVKRTYYGVNDTPVDPGEYMFFPLMRQYTSDGMNLFTILPPSQITDQAYMYQEHIEAWLKLYEEAKK